MHVHLPEDCMHLESSVVTLQPRRLSEVFVCKSTYIASTTPPPIWWLLMTSSNVCT